MPRLGSLERVLLGTHRAAKVALYGPTGLPLLFTDDSAFTPAASPLLPVGYEVDDVAPVNAAEGHVGIPRMTATRIPTATLRSADDKAWDYTTNPDDASANATAAGYMMPRVMARLEEFDGVTWNRRRNNSQATLLASAIRAASNDTPDQTNINARGVMLFLDITANPGGAETLTVSVKVKNPVSGIASTLAAFPATAAAANNPYIYTVYPGATETIAQSQHEVQALALPRVWYVTVTHSGAGNWTYSLGYCYLSS